MKPNREAIAKWVKALRGGDYEQGHHVLRFDEEFCVLGVACDVSGVGRWEGGAPQLYGAGGTALETMPPFAVREWLGLGETVLNDIARRNDGDGAEAHSFDTLADYLEAEYLCEWGA